MRRLAREIFSGKDPEKGACPDCGGVHVRACPRVASERVVLDDKGQPRERHVTYWAPGTWEDACLIIWADDAFDSDENPGPDGDGESGGQQLE